MKTRRIMIGLVGLSLLAGAAIGCGDDFTVGAFPRIEVSVDGTLVESGVVIDIPQALQLPVSKNVEIVNPGNKTLTITGIDWAVDPETGAKLKNKYVEIDWRGLASADLFPYLLAEGASDSFEFVVKYTPPLGYALDDFSDSVLVISSDARNNDGSKAVSEVRVTFAMARETAVPRVTPANSYTFTNATPAQPERQTFRIYNDPQLATAPFVIEDIRLQNPSSEFHLLDLPSAGQVVLAPNDAGYQDVTFIVEYRPVDDTPDTNVLLIDTDAGSLSVQLKSEQKSGSYSLSFDHPSGFDFTNVTTVETRSLQIVSQGPSSIAIQQPKITPEEAKQDFELKVFKPATTAGEADVEVTSWPQGLAVGRSLRFEVTYRPRTDGSDTANGQLDIPYDAPARDHIYIDLFSGKPKSKIVLAPATGNIYVAGDADGGETGTRNAVIYNEGNGPLQLVDAVVNGSFVGVPPEVWSLHSAFSAAVVPVGGLLVLPLDYDLSGLPGPDATASESLVITYYDDFTGQNEEKTLAVLAADDGGLEHPVADPGAAEDYADAVVDEPVTLSGAGSSGGAGSLSNQSYIWYLTAKPAGSLAKLNTQAGASVQFIPDVAGDYTVELVVYAQAGDRLLYSDPATVTISVSE